MSLRTNPVSPHCEAVEGRARLLRLTAVILVVLFAAVLVQVSLHGGPVWHLDQYVARRENLAIRSDPDRVAQARLISRAGSTVVLAIIVAAAATWLMSRHRRQAATFVIATSVVGNLLNSLLKGLVARGRPQFIGSLSGAAGFSFPSGHAMNSTVVYGSIVYAMWPLLPRPMARLIALASAACVVATVAAARVILNVHFVSDVSAGILAGAALVLGSATVTYPPLEP